VPVKQINLHHEQERAICSNKRITVMCAGIQGGKTFSGAIWMRKRVAEMTKPDCNFLVTAPTYKMFNQATEPAFLEMFKGLGEYNKTKQNFVMPNNRMVYLRTLHDPNAIEGITRLEGIWGDEAGLYNAKAMVNLEGRSAFRQCPQFYTTTPYSLGYMYQSLYKPWREGKRDDVEFIQFRSVDNPYFPKEEFERQKALLDPRVFAMKYEGQFKKMAGLVFMDFDDTLNMTEVPDHGFNKELYHICGGVDWGYTNPFALTIRAIHKYEPRDYQIDEFYQSGLNPIQKTEIAKKMWDKYNLVEWYADNEAPDMINLFNTSEMPTMGAKKYNGSVVDNIDRHRAIIRTREHKLIRGMCPHTIDEYETYHYKEDDGKEENTNENPVDAQNHLMTANLYATQCTEHIRQKQKEHNAVKLTEKSHLDKLLDGEFATEKENSWYDG